MPVQQWSKSDQRRPRATSKQVPRATSRQPLDTHTCGARTSRACTAKSAAAAAAAAPTVPQRSSCYLITNSTTEPILVTIAPAELVAVVEDLTCAGGVGFEDGLRAILVTASAIPLIVVSSTEPPTTFGDDLTAARPSSRSMAPGQVFGLAAAASTEASRKAQGDGQSPSASRLAGRMAWPVEANTSAGGEGRHRHGEGKVTVFGGYAGHGLV